jgi:cell division protein FtsQ
LTQCEYFKVKDLKIEGLQRLTPAHVAQQAQVQPDANILAVNLTLVRKRLLADPWIAEAEVKREIPSGLRIRIKEHTPLAVIDIGEKFLINQRGEIFKEWHPGDPGHLPVISGLEVGDLRINPPSALSEHPGEPGYSAPFNAVMQVLQLGEQQGSILPNRNIKYICVDRQMGLTLYAFDQLKMINLGYNDYASKYHMLENLFSYLKHQNSVTDFSRIDLNNVNRIVLNPSNN